MEAAKDALKAKIDDFCLDTVRACILVGNLYGAEGDSNTESVFFAIAFRIAHVIKLPAANAGDNEIVREEKVRAWWSLYMVDRWSSAGLDVPRQMPDDGHIALPLYELDFYAMEPHSNQKLVTHRKSGLWAEMVRLARDFGRIQDLHKQYADADINTREVERTTGELSQKLETFVDRLPEQFQLTEHNLRRHASKGLGRDLVALHLGYYHYATLLHFPYLDLHLEANQNQELYALRCRENAAALSDLLSKSWLMDGCKPVYFIVAHMITVSSSALIHGLLFGDEATISDIRRRLESNFQALIELRSYWPAAAMMVSLMRHDRDLLKAYTTTKTDRLFTFQDMCFRSADPNTHKADKWMVKFLLQHGSPIDEKAASVSMLDDTSPTLLDRDRGRYTSDALSVLRSAQSFHNTDWV